MDYGAGEHSHSYRLDGPYCEHFLLFLNFRRMNYTDAIVYLKEHDIRKDDGTFYEFGEVSTILYT